MGRGLQNSPPLTLTAFKKFMNSHSCLPFQLKAKGVEGWEAPKQAVKGIYSREGFQR